MDLYTAQIFISKLYSSTLFLKIANSKYEWSANGKIVFILEKDNTDEWHLYEYKYFGSSTIINRPPRIKIKIQIIESEKKQRGSLIFDTGTIIDDIIIDRSSNKGIIYLNTHNEIIFLEYTNMTTTYFSEIIQDQECIQFIKKCIKICKDTIIEMYSREHITFLDELCSFVFGTKLNRINVLESFGTIFSALDNIDFCIPKNILDYINGFNINKKNWIIFNLYGGIGLGGSIPNYNIATKDYTSINIIQFDKSYFMKIKRYNNPEPNLIKKSFCELLIHEVAHMSLNLERDKIYAFTNSDEWSEIYFLKGTRTIQFLINLFCLPANEKRKIVHASNAEHFAVFFDLFYLYINGKGMNPLHIIMKSGLGKESQEV